MGRPSVAIRLATFGVAASVTLAFFINLCNAIFRCGCRSVWAGAADHCNIHVNGVKHCPWCSHGTEAYVSVLALVLIPQFLVSWWPAPWDWRLRLFAALLAFPVVGLLAALAFGWFDGYWA
jgi:hypothetical protein